MSGECEKCGEHTLECECNPTHNKPETHYNYNNALNFIMLLDKCKCESCQNEKKKLEKKYGLE